MASAIDITKIDVATPCQVGWETMSGDERKRFCGQCKKNVYNLSDMSEGEAGDFLSLELSSNRIPCIQFYRRSDGTILFEDCPVGLRRVRDSARKMAKLISGAVAASISLFCTVLSAVAAPAPDADKTSASARELPGGGRAVNGSKTSAKSCSAVENIYEMIQHQQMMNEDLSNGARLNGHVEKAEFVESVGEQGKSNSESSELKSSGKWLRGDYAAPVIPASTMPPTLPKKSPATIRGMVRVVPVLNNKKNESGQK